MRIRVEPNVPDAWVLGAIVIAGAGVVLAISALRLGAVDPRPASPLSAPTVAPTALTTNAPATAAPASSPATVDPNGVPAQASPLRTFVPAESPLPTDGGGRGTKTPDLPPPGYRLANQD
jgi:hypothetical protein